MTHGIPPSNPEPPHSVSKQSDTHTGGSGKIPPWRFVWLGIGVAAVLWVGSSIYLQRAHELAEIEYQAGNVSEADYSALALDYARYAIACKISAGVMAFGSLLYLVSQMGIRRAA